MKKRICQMAALGSALLLAFSAPVQAAAVTANGTPAAVATNNVQNWPAGPETTSEAAVLIDADTGAVLYDKGMNEYRYPASTTKLMTILLATENSSPKDVVTFTETGIRDVTWDSSNINAQLGEQMTMKDCWMAAYIKSANEVCAQIAETVGGTEANFVEMMNQKAKELGCNKIALGHHYDDVIETILMGMLYGAQIQTMMPKLHSTNFEGMELIRPLYLVREDDIKAWRDYNDLHFIQCACKFTDTCTTCNNEENQSKRVEIKELIKRLKQVNPYVEGNIFKSIENVNLSTVIAYKKDGVKHSFLEEYDD